MVIGLVGISGVGKSYLKKQAIKNITNLTTLFATTTRPKRESEIDGVDKYFISESEFLKKNSKNEMFLVQEIYGFMYGFLKKDVTRHTNFITEMLHTDITEMKRFTNVKIIYIYSNNLKMIRDNLELRYNDSCLLQERIDKDVIRRNEHETMLSHNLFNYTFENFFDEHSVINFISLIKNIIGACPD
jgi:guanylate kinase